MNCPSRSAATRSAAFSTPRWCDTDAKAIGNCSAISPAVRSFSVSSSRILRRVGSARARNSESSMGGRYLYKRLTMSRKLTKSAPITSLHTMSPADKALDRSRALRRVLGGLLIASIAVLVAKATIGILAGSLSGLGDALHSSVDAVYNVLGLVVVRVA